MRSSFLILVAGILAAAACYIGVYQSRTAAERALLHQPQPELSWLKKEFKLSDAEFERVAKLHSAYLPQCAEMCRRISSSTAQLQELLDKTNAVTADIEAKLRQTAQLHAECQLNMLRHFYNVSKAMPPEEGRRYLEWVQAKTLISGRWMEEQSGHE